MRGSSDILRARTSEAAGAHVYVESSICSGAAGAGDPGDCPDSFSAPEQAELAGRLRDLRGDVRFVDADEARRLTRAIFGKRPRFALPVRGAVLLRVGLIEGGREGPVTVPGSYYCGGLCAGGATWLLRLEAGGVGGHGAEGRRVDLVTP